MLGCSTFHLYLHLTIAWVHIVKLLLTTLAGVKFLLTIQILVQVEYLAFTRQEETEGI